MAAMAGGEAGEAGRVTGSMERMEIDADGSGIGTRVSAGEKVGAGAPAEAGGMVAPGARARASGGKVDAPAVEDGQSMEGSSVGSTGQGAEVGAQRDAAATPNADAGDERPQQESQQVPRRLRFVKEFWCLRSAAAFPKAEEAAVAVKELVVDAWGGHAQLKGFPLEVRVHDKVKNWEADPAATGMVCVTRAADDGWQLEGWERLKRQAWPLTAGIESCKWVKAFGASSEHAREVNWLMGTLFSYLEAGLPLSMDPKCIIFGYAELPPRVARLNGAEWSGFVYGANLPLQDLIEVVEWGNEKAKEPKALKAELKVDKSRRGIISCFIPAGSPGHRFQPADFIAGSFTLLIESQLSMFDFDMEAGDEPFGITLLCEMFGDHVVLDVTPSVGGLVGSGIVRVKVKCGLRYEKEARAHVQKLIQESREDDAPRTFIVDDREVDLRFYSEDDARAVTESLEGRRNKGKGNPLAASELAAVAKALAEVKNIQSQSIKRLDLLAEDQREAAISCAGKIEDLARLQASAAVDSKEKFEATQSQLAALAVGQAQAAQDCREQMADVQRQAFAFAQTLHLQLTDAIGGVTAALVREKPKLTQKGLQATVENVPPGRQVGMAGGPCGLQGGLRCRDGLLLDLGWQWDGLASSCSSFESTAADVSFVPLAQRGAWRQRESVLLIPVVLLAGRYDTSSGVSGEASVFFSPEQGRVSSASVGQGRPASQGRVGLVRTGRSRRRFSGQAGRGAVGVGGATGLSRANLRDVFGAEALWGRGPSVWVRWFWVLLCVVGIGQGQGEVSWERRATGAGGNLCGGGVAKREGGVELTSLTIEWGDGRCHYEQHLCGRGSTSASENRGHGGFVEGSASWWEGGAQGNHSVVSVGPRRSDRSMEAVRAGILGGGSLRIMQVRPVSARKAGFYPGGAMVELVACTGQMLHACFRGSHEELSHARCLGHASQSAAGSAEDEYEQEVAASPSPGVVIRQRRWRPQCRGRQTSTPYGGSLTCRDPARGFNSSCHVADPLGLGGLRSCLESDVLSAGCDVARSVGVQDAVGRGWLGRPWRLGASEFGRGVGHLPSAVADLDERRWSGGTVAEAGERGVTRMHSHCKSLVCDRAGGCCDRGSRRGRNSHGSGLGDSPRCAGLGGLHSQGAGICFFCAGSGHYGTGSSLSCDPRFASEGVGAGVAAVPWSLCVDASLCVALLGHRRGCGGDELPVCGRMEVLVGCGGGGSGQEGARNGLGGQARTLSGRCAQHGSEAGLVESEGTSGHLLYELEVCAMVIGQHHTFVKAWKAAATHEGGGGGSGAATGGLLGSSQDHHHRVRCGTLGAQVQEILGLDCWFSSPAIGMGMDVASHGPGRAIWRRMAQEEIVGGGPSKAGLVRVLPCLLGCWLVVLGRRVLKKDLGAISQAWCAAAVGACWRSRLRLLREKELLCCSSPAGKSVGLRRVSCRRALMTTCCGSWDKAATSGSSVGTQASAGSLGGTVASGTVAAPGLAAGGGGAVLVRPGPGEGELEPSAPAEAGTCLFWNARQLCMPLASDARACKDWAGGGGKAAAAKLRFLMDKMDETAPWLVAVLEVDGAPGRMRAFRAWFRRRGYEMVFLPGEGSSKGGVSSANGIVLAVSREVQLVESKRVAFRSLAVQTFHKKSRRLFNVVLMHGSSVDAEEASADGVGCFGHQLAAAMEWCLLHDGALLMDANRVPCARWRSPRSGRLTKGDVDLRQAAGWGCACCGESTWSALGSGQFIGRQTDASGEAVWTRWGVASEAESVKSRLDVGIACGQAYEVWVGAETLRPPASVSDHAMICYSLLAIPPAGPQGQARPLPVRLGERPRNEESRQPGSAWVVMRRLSSEDEFLEQLRAGTDRAERCEGSVVEELVPLFRSLGERAVQVAREEKAQLRGRWLGGRQAFDAKSDRKVWDQRIQLARAIWRGRRDMSFLDWLMLFHPRSGMSRYSRRFSTDAGRKINWAAYIRRCRRQWERALFQVERRNRESDNKLASLCHRLAAASSCCDTPTHINVLWRMLRDGRGSDKVRRLYAGDVKSGKVFLASDEEFLQEAGRIGQLFVQSMDRGCCPEALQAWLEVFVARRPTIQTRGGLWEIEREFSYAAYLRTLQAMRGKAVGAGGLSVELLLAASKEAKWLFYQALLADARSGRFAASWKRVLYVLLRKPAPNDPDIISQRREIALMPQDLKILLQGVKKSTYTRIGDRLGAEQYGWKAGYGCADPGLALAAVLQQARRLQHPVYVLYIDLANFFPAINRRAAEMCESWAGLPSSVAEVVAAVYGAADDPGNAVRCQYETEVGLGAEFRNHVGRLMGCPLSPDSAKILLESIISAIRRSVTGVAMWPFVGAEITQIAYADDWTGVFDDVEQLRKAWALWMVWAEMIGAKLGIKGFFKSVVSGTLWVAGQRRAIPNPHLRDCEGTEVPVAEPDRLYKHLGVPRACSAEGRLTWVGGEGVVGIRDKLKACISRLRRLRRHGTSCEQFMCISNVLLGGMAGVYLQSVPVSLEETEEIERAWRRALCRFARRDFASPAAELYGSGLSWTKGRTHIYGTGSAALFSAIEKAMADPQPAPAREAVRSAIALALYCWGCRSEPGKWSWKHLESELRSSLKGRGLRGLGEAWMLAVLEMEGGRDPVRDKAVRDEELRVRAWGRWRGMAEGDEESNPLAGGNAWFQRRSVPLFEPQELGGLGLPVQVELLKMGIAELQDLTSNPIRGSGADGRWLTSKPDVRARLHGRLLSPAAWKAWSATVQAVQDSEIAAVRPDRSGSSWLEYSSYRRTGCDAEGVKRLLHALTGAKARATGDTPAEVWAARMRKAFSPKQVSDECVGSDDDAWRRVAIGWSVDKSGAEDFIFRGELDLARFPAAWDVEWRDQMVLLRDCVHFSQDDGWPYPAAGSRDGVDEGFVAQLAPALQLAVRARLVLGKETSVLKAGWGCKVPGWRVALDAQRHSWEVLCELQARLDFQFAFAMDASSSAQVNEKGLPVRDEWGWPCQRTAAVAVSHLGETLGGVLDSDLPSDNYVGELVALVVALRSVPSGSRVLLVFDATSPVRAWRKFRHRCVRGRWKYHAATYLNELDGLLARQKLVYFLWQSSHCGAPVNEVADINAGRVRMDEEAVCLREAEESSLFSMWPSRPMGPLFAWASRAMEAVCVGRLNAGAGLFPSEDDWDLGRWDEHEGLLLGALRRGTLMVGDEGHRDARFGEREAAKAACPLGCMHGASSWAHYAFWCAHPELRDERDRWREWLIRWRPAFDGLGIHAQLDVTMPMLGGLQPRAGVLGRDPPLVLARRLLAGLVEKGPLADARQEERARSTVRDMVRGGVALLWKAVQLESELRRHTVGRIIDNRNRLKLLRRWYARCLRVGPGRAACLLQIRVWRGIAQGAVAMRTAEGSLDAQAAVGVLRRMGCLFAEAHRKIRTEVGEVSKEIGVTWFCSWQWYRAVLGRGRRVWEIPAFCEELRLVRDEALRLWPAVARISVWRTTRIWYLSGLGCGGAPIRLGIKVPGIKDRALTAFRKWLRWGGVPLLRKLTRARGREATASRKALPLQDRARAQEAIRNYSAGLACSGRALPRVAAEHKIVIEVAPRSKRARAESRWRAGSVADRHGRWAVDNIIMVRSREPLERGCEALVDWTGPFEPSWVPFSALCGPAKVEAKRMAKEFFGPPSDSWWELEMLIEACRPELDPEEGRKRPRRSPRLIVASCDMSDSLSSCSVGNGDNEVLSGALGSDGQTSVGGDAQRLAIDVRSSTA